MGPVSAAKKAALPSSIAALREAIEGFLAAARVPVLVEPGESPFALAPGRFRLSQHGDDLLIETWDTTRTLARHLPRMLDSRTGQLTFATRKFGGRSGELTLLDQDRPQAAPRLQKAQREVLEAQFERWLGRQYPGWTLKQVSCGGDLENTLSSACPRALIARGALRWAALAAGPTHAAVALTHGILWLDYLRRRDHAPVEGLILFLPVGATSDTLLRLNHLRLRCELFHYDETGFEARVDPADRGNLVSQLDPWTGSAPAHSAEWMRRLALIDDVEIIAVGAAAFSLRVRGLEFARCQNGEFLAGIDRPRRPDGYASVEDLARELAGVRRPGSPAPRHPWLRRNPEAWMESVLRRQIGVVDAGLLDAPVYGQVPTLAGLERACLDLLAIDFSGRLAVIELKATEDPHLPLQALDYWIRVRHHAEGGDFHRCGYFPGLDVRPVAPRLFLVAPALHFHPTTETVLAYFDPQIPVSRLGLGVEWQRNPRVVLRVEGAGRAGWH